MFTFSEPSNAQIENFLATQRELPFSYKEVGASQNAVPEGYPINHYRARLGAGEAAFARAKDALQNWTMYELEWTKIYPPGTPVEPSGVVCVIVNHGFCWSLNSCRIVYVVEETAGAVEHFGFAFGTLPGHSEEGEERFTIERRLDDDSVWYELLAFARPHHILAKMGSPFVRLTQRRFARDSFLAVRKAIDKKI